MTYDHDEREFIAVGYGSDSKEYVGGTWSQVRHSTDGNYWKPLSLGVSGSTVANYHVWYLNEHVILGSSIVVYSDSIDFPDDRIYPSGLAFGRGVFVASTEQRGVQRFDPHQTPSMWEKVTSNETKDFRDILFAQGRFVAVGKGGSILSSPDGINWNMKKSGTEDDLFVIAYGNETFVILGNNQTLLTSNDGDAWELSRF